MVHANHLVMVIANKINMTNKCPFLLQTARDYDMEYHDVERIYKFWNDEGLFYDKLEEFIKDRRNSH